ncbi:MAG: hypothetical protein EOP51_06610 [Sphingobacteriales bacterium]|nr:MAG: hypothetical protein EOP51_06610 [Sphingobacteriales bacterium]
MLQIAGNNYLLRTPLLPVNFAEKVFTEDIAKVAENKAFMYGLYLSSKDIYEEFVRQLNENAVTEKMRHSLQKYWSRASSRCTPYANFAGCSLGELSDHTGITVANASEHKEACRLDMDLIYRFLNVLYADEKIREQITYHANSTLYKLAGKYRYIRYNFNGKRSYFLAEIEPTPYLKHIITQSANGVSYTQLKDYLLPLCDDNEEDAKNFLNTIISNQIIVSELEPNVSGDEPFKKLLNILKKYQHTEQYVQLIEHINNTLKNNIFDINKLQVAIEAMKESRINISVQTLFQCDVNTATPANTINKKIIEDVLNKAEDLIKLFKIGKGSHDALEGFKRKFMEKYEGQTVPLFEVMDVENGIGYGNSSGNINPFISDIKFGNDAATNANPLIDLVNKQLGKSAQIPDTIYIKKEDLQLDQKKAKGKPQDALSFDISQHMYLMGSLHGKDAAAIDNGEYTFWLKMIGGSSYANLLSRFAHIDEGIGNWIKGLTMSEEEGLPEDVIYAEVIHLPQERLGNISQRPVLRSYEIPYLGNSGSSKEQQIPVSDLVVSIERGRIVLKSQRLNKRIIPRLTNAHNYSMDSLPIYKFLCDLQMQDSFGGVGPDRLVNISGSYTPRVMYENVILKRATWKVTKDDFTDLKKDPKRSVAELMDVKAARKIPNQVVLMQSDNELLIDFNHNDSVLIFLSYVEKHQQVQVAEFLGDVDNSFIEGEQGRFNSELLIPIKIAADSNAQAAAEEAKKKIAATKRIYVPGEEWVYFKWYCSTNFCDELLQGSLKKLTALLVKKKLVTEFFFLRYTDPDFHLRIRFKLTDVQHFGEVISMVRNFTNRYVAQGMITKMQLDTYAREIERYGERSIDLSEHIFFTDSQLAIDLLNTMNEYEDDGNRWKLALAGIDAYLNDFGYSLPEKVSFLEVLQKNFLTEFGNGQTLTHSLNDKYRNLKDPIFGLFRSDNSGYNLEAAEYNTLFAKRTKANKQVVEQLKALYTGEREKLDDILRSYIHMYMNRLFASENRRHELAIYHLLAKYYTSQKAIQQKGSEPKVKKEKNAEQKTVAA